MSRKISKRSSSIALAAMAGVSLLAVQAHAASTAPSTQAAKASAPAPRPIKASWGEIQPFWGEIQPFWGEIQPFWGEIQPFWGEIQPFWGEIQPFWGEIQPFETTSTTTSTSSSSSSTGSVNFWGTLPGYRDAKGKANGDKVGDYWKDAGEEWEEVMGVWAKAQKSGSKSDLKKVTSKVGDLMEAAEDFWGTTYTAQTGKTFTNGFVTPLLAKYGVSTSDPESYAKLTKSQQSMLFMDLYDGLMRYAKADHVDHWMGTVRWNPQLTQTQGSGADTVIGLLDFTVLNGSIVKNNIVSYGGTSKFTNGHGAAVAGLMVGAHDGKGVMGISPRSRVIAFNPFDETGTAGWEDVATGVKMLTANRASIVNMSLGIPGTTLDQGWNGVFSRSDVSETAKNSLFVVAAGNEGVSQTKDIAWNFKTNPEILIVGSVTLDGKISNFSNRPGTACLLSDGKCLAGARLMDRFLVAPGELILVEDDAGGVKRATGTSLAAPLVSGAAALIQDRWPWFAAKPAETAYILLESARDLGARGVDAVYGAGLLDITAAQSPLDFGTLVWYKAGTNGKLAEYSVKQVLRDFDSEDKKGISSVGLYYYAFEKVGTVERDFGIPLSSRLIGQTFTTKSGSSEFFQGYILSRLSGWAKSQNRDFAEGGSSLGFGPGETLVANPWGADMTLSLAPREVRPGFEARGMDMQSRLHLSTDTATADFGFGDGARYLAAFSGRASAADFNPTLGGVSPMLGLASGGAYMGYEGRLTDRLSLTTGATERTDRRDDSSGTSILRDGSAAETYSARAGSVGMNYRVSDAIAVSAGYVRLKEDTAVLGVQSLEAADFGDGAVSDSINVGLQADLGAGVRLNLSGSVGETRTVGAAALQTEAGGLKTSAWQATLSAQDLFASGDSARLSLSQPLFIEKGLMSFSGVEVVNRMTGDKGVVSRAFDVAQERPFAGEVEYGRRLPFGQSEVSFFGRAELNPTYTGEKQVYLTGARLRVGF